jgi:hypothetical protein
MRNLMLTLSDRPARDAVGGRRSLGPRTDERVVADDGNAKRHYGDVCVCATVVGTYTPASLYGRLRVYRRGL